MHGKDPAHDHARPGRLGVTAAIASANDAV